MIGFSYIYKSSDEIFSWFTHLSHLSIVDVAFVAIAVSITFFSIFVFIPSVIISIEHIHEQKEKRNKKKILSQILLQKEIEDEVESEIQIEDENTLV